MTWAVALPPVAPAVMAKASRLAIAGRVRQVPAQVYEVQGDHALYIVVVRDNIVSCSCPATVPCAHLYAAGISAELRGATV